MPIPSTTAALGQLAEPFGRFWLAYPARRPNPRAAAAREFASLCRHDRTEAERLIAAARAYAEECRRLQVRPEYVPHARTWLSQRRFEDYPPYAAEEAVPAAPAGGVPAAVRAHAWWPVAGRCGVAPHEFSAYLAPLVVREWHERRLAVVAAPSRFVADTVRARFVPVLARVLEVESVEVVP
jgi:hypothetical protein